VAATKERAAELAELNLPPGTKYLLIPFEGVWAWLFVGKHAEEHET
jgi:hypothetical protein